MSFCSICGSLPCPKKGGAEGTNNILYYIKVKTGEDGHVLQGMEERIDVYGKM